ncbi:FAM92 protein domain-containing protein [Rozella allomycis CSF55]|uniref:FAM92 protein domain-containing protein n=1 Tax=Rozella allomycis (strain CSF55) TaxID=988480 RepID=A0A075B0Q5_ROZAC|nr:FAM92 protein domain-containing protein [Rozella allomycis CSF55]|eukprot:EPZ34406.1 FAM92 protein domain-containing protein [Rozella allomycis CSF55]
MLGSGGSDDLARWIKKRVHNTEKCFAFFESELGGYLRNQGRTREKNLKISGVLKNISDLETPNLNAALENVALAFDAVEQHRKIMIDRMDVRAKQNLHLYKIILAHKIIILKDELKLRENAVTKETKKQQALEKATIKSGIDKTKIVQSQLELAGANQEVVHSNLALTEHVERFETQKMLDIKSILEEILYSEMVFHAKSLELYSEAKNILQAANIEEDIEYMNERLKFTHEEDLIKKQ